MHTLSYSLSIISEAGENSKGYESVLTDFSPSWKKFTFIVSGSRKVSLGLSPWMLNFLGCQDMNQVVLKAIHQ